MLNMKDLSTLDQIIVGRVEPHIYAFTTNTIPNYLKVGDTYRPVNVRLNEWREYYPSLRKEYEEKAMINEDIFFRDYSVHQFIENDLHKQRIKPEDFPNEKYISNEFFKDTKVIDVQCAIDDIKKSFEENLMKYKYYDASTNLITIQEYASTGYWTPRPNQQEVIDNFKNALAKGRNNLLMYAVMRFGKSFTSMCCAVEMKANIVLIVSAKADVKEEWKKTVESADNFNDYKFISSFELNDDKIIEKTLSSGKKVVMFLTLQDLQGEEIKERHKELFNNKIDLLLIDETHFGARAEKYGAVLREMPIDVLEKREDGFIDIEEATNQLKFLNSKVKIHLSGTPYRILMGSEFEKDDIIAFCQFPDIVKAQQEWDKEFLNNEKYNEWDNPYYGFPQMIRFAFNPNESVRRKLEELKANGVSYAFSELFKPLSIQKDSNNLHKKFKYENEVLDLLEVIDGSKNDDEVLGFLDYDKIKQGKMCRHIVMVLPYCASCDCIENLIKTNIDKFKNLNEYEIINISGVDKSNEYKKVLDIKNKIKECEKNNKKTLTLTVNRMLTGSTVEEWDTMIYLKDTSSPQEYDQAIFRLQNQFTREYLSEDGDQIKFNKKPQTLLVDFDPNRMFIMQENKSLIYNANIDKSGNSKLQERLENELKISPIIVFNKDKIKQITASDIMQYISNYSNSRGVLDEANDIPVDMSLLNIDEIRNIIVQQAQIGTKNGLKINNTDDEPDDMNFEQLNIDFGDLENLINHVTDTSSSTSETNELEEIDYNSLLRVLTRKFKTYYARLLFFSFLTDSKVNSLESIIDVLDENINSRIAVNLGLDKSILKLILKNIDPFKLSQLDYKIQNINSLSTDNELSQLDRALVAVNKFDKLSISEIVTPQNICYDMISLIGINNIIEVINSGGRILDIASKEGEFTLSLYKLLKENNVDISKIKKSLYAIPTSSVAYEFTRKIYEILDLDVDNISKEFTTYDLLNIKDNNEAIDYNKINDLLSQKMKFSEIDLEMPIRKEKYMNFDIIVGNPPYQENISKEEGNSSLAKQLFPSFVKLSMELNPKYSSLIIPSKWFLADAQDKSFIKLREYIKEHNHIKNIVNFTGNNEVFKDVNVGSVSYFLYEKDYSGNVEFIENSDDKISKVVRPLFEEGLDVILPINNPNLFSILKKVRNHKEFSSLMEIANGRNAFGVVGKDSVVKKISKENYFEGAVSLRCAHEIIRYIDESEITKNIETMKSWKIITSKANGGAGLLTDNKQVSIIGKSYLAPPMSACTDSLIPIGCFNTKEEAENLLKYMSTKFLRFMVGIVKSSQNLYQPVYRFVPIQDFSQKSDIDWSKSILEIDKQLFKKYNFTNDEITFINEKIKDLEN